MYHMVTGFYKSNFLKAKYNDKKIIRKHLPKGPKTKLELLNFSISISSWSLLPFNNTPSTHHMAVQAKPIYFQC